jgi:membrane protease YdiL (CAAX protease family)
MVPSAAMDLLEDRFTPTQIKLLMLVNPSIFLVVFILMGLFVYDKVELRLPIIERLVGIQQEEINYSDILKAGVFGGPIAGALLSLISYLFIPFLPQEFIDFGEQFNPGPTVRFLYGGITEEILMRFGLMSILVWLVFIIRGKLKSSAYWIGIVVAAVLFGVGHLPIAYQAIDQPTSELIAYVIIGNTVGGIIFGWLYWKKGLECAMIAHIFAHVAMMIIGV